MGRLSIILVTLAISSPAGHGKDGFAESRFGYHQSHQQPRPRQISTPSLANIAST
jgi:hypothetical protein